MRKLGEWAARGACAGQDSTLFFPDRENSVDIPRAKAVCATCTVREPCLEDALQTPFADDEGIWGGTTKQERVRIRLFLGARSLQEAVGDTPDELGDFAAPMIEVEAADG